MSKSMSNFVVPVVPKGPPGQDVLYLNTKLLSIKSHTINSIEALQTVSCQMINSLSLPVCPSLISFADNWPYRGKRALFNYHEDYEVRAVPNANSQIAAVHLCIRRSMCVTLLFGLCRWWLTADLCTSFDRKYRLHRRQVQWSSERVQKRNERWINEEFILTQTTMIFKWDEIINHNSCLLR